MQKLFLGLLLLCSFASIGSAQIKIGGSSGSGNSATPSSLFGTPNAIYLFNEGTGSTIHDTSGNHYDCTIINTYTWLPVQGVTNSNINGEIDCPNGAFNNIGLLQVWFQPLQSLEYNNIFIRQSISSDQVYGSATARGLVFTQPGILTNMLVDHVEGNTSASFVLNPFVAYINGKPSFGTVEPPVTAGFRATSGVMWIGGANGTGSSYQGNIYAIVTYAAGTYTAAQVAQNDAYIWGMLAKAGYRPANPDLGRPLALYLGDSITEGTGADPTYGEKYNLSYPYFAEMIDGGSSRAFYNLGQSGQTAAGIDSNFTAAYVPILTNYRFGAPIVHLMAGVNDSTNTQSAASIVASYNSICSKVHAANQAAKCLVATITSNSSWNGTQLGIRNTVNSTLVSQWLAGSFTGDGVIDVSDDPIVGNVNYMSQASCSPDGLHFTGSCYAIIGQRFALADALLYAQKPHWLNIQIPYTYFTLGSGVAALTSTLNLLQLGPNQQVCGVSANVTTAFTGTTTLTASVGDSVGTATQYLTAQNMKSLGRTMAQAPNYYSATGVVQAAFTATVNNLSSLSSGNLNIDLCVVTIP